MSIIDKIKGWFKPKPKATRGRIGTPKQQEKPKGNQSQSRGKATLTAVVTRADGTVEYHDLGPATVTGG